MPKIAEYYSNYTNTMEGFKRFHNQVINMPRDAFSDTSLEKVQKLANYLLLTEGRLDGKKGYDYKDIMKCIFNRMHEENYITADWQDAEIDELYFNYKDINDHYEINGRMFRHLMGICGFFGMFRKITKNKKVINYDKCREYVLSSTAVLIPIERNNFMQMNVSDNVYIDALNGINLTDGANYRPTYGILFYMKNIERPVTKFELSVLLGRIDEVQEESEIIARALNIGRTLPADQTKQEIKWFSQMGWESDGKSFAYAPSQEPHFKFANYLYFLQAFELIRWDAVTKTYSLTEYSEELLEGNSVQDIFANDYQKLLDILDDYTANNSQLSSIILQDRNPQLLKIIQSDPEFIYRMNMRSLNMPQFNKDGSRKRNKLIAELVKIQADYKCQYLQKHTFPTKNGKYYCEAHHIIEFNGEDGPDITNNLVVLGAEAHMRIHHGDEQTVRDTFTTLVRNNVINLDRFKEMIQLYHCMTRAHIEALKNKGAITDVEKEELIDLLEKQGE